MVDRPNWDDYFMGLAFLSAIRSIDPSSKCGCVLVDDKNRIISIGYNGPIRGIPDDKVSLERPDKYFEMEHAERNAIFSARVSLDNLGAKAYITGPPCCNCLRALIQSGVKTMIIGPARTFRVFSDDPDSMAERKAIEKIIDYSGITYRQYDGDVISIFDRLFSYMESKEIDVGRFKKSE